MGPSPVRAGSTPGLVSGTAVSTGLSPTTRITLPDVLSSTATVVSCTVSARSWLGVAMPMVRLTRGVAPPAPVLLGAGVVVGRGTPGGAPPGGGAAAGPGGWCAGWDGAGRPPAGRGDPQRALGV